jgi:hypothetical protein
MQRVPGDAQNPCGFEHDNHYPANIFLVVNDQYSHRATCLLFWGCMAAMIIDWHVKSEKVSSAKHPLAVLIPHPGIPA